MPLSHQLPSACLRTSPRRILQFPSGIRTLQCRTLSQFARLPAATLRHNLSGNVTTHAAHQRRTFISKYLPKKLTSSFLAGRSRAAQAQLLKPAPGEQYGQQLMIYRIGARSFLLGPLKIYAVLQFAYCVGYVIPSAWDPEEWWWAAAAAAASIVPLVFLGYLSPPYVTNVYLKLPPYARRTSQGLTQYVATLPKDAVVQFATVHLTARPRHTQVFLGDLMPTKKRFGCVNLVATLRGKKPGERYFYVDPRGSPAKVDEPEVIKEVLKAAERFAREKEAVGRIDPALKWWEHLPKNTSEVPATAASKTVAEAPKTTVTAPSAPARKVVRKIA